MPKQVFQTNSSTRWTSFKWVMRVLVFFLVVIISSVVVSLIQKRNYDLKVLTYNEKKLPDLNIDKSKTLIPKKEELDFAKDISLYRKHHRKSFYESNHFIPSELKKFFPVRAAFYVNWDINSLSSLQRNINQMNMVIPEWYFLSGTEGKVTSIMQQRTLEFAHKNKVSIIPMLSNFKHWGTDSTSTLLKNRISREKLIKAIETVLDTNDYQGINIDFENIPIQSRPYLLQFSKELYEQLHPEKYITTIDLSPNDCLQMGKELAPYYDFIFVMAYNQHLPTDEPGSTSSLNFVEESLDKAMIDIPSNKIVLGIGAFGYNWGKGLKTEKVTYQNMISLANEFESKVIFDFANACIFTNYYDDNGILHQVYCNDASSTFNLIRTAEEYNAAGVALWYLGSEDQRMWNFYRYNLDKTSLKKHPFNFSELQTANPIESINYSGEGEILEMINEPDSGFTKITFDPTDYLITEEIYKDLPSPYMLKRYGANKEKKIAITFDDGPNNEYTPQILDILKKKKVPATFFVTGVNIENNIPLVHRIYNEGHEIGNHTFTHPNLEITSANRERIELRSTRLLLESILHHTTLLFRPPYNTDAEPTSLTQIKSLAIAHDEGFICVTCYIDPNDWEDTNTADSIVAKACRDANKGNVLLLHDAGGDRQHTIDALPRIIDYYRQHGYKFVSISELMGKTRNQVMPEVSGKFKLTERLDLIFFSVTYLWDHFLHGFFVVAILLIILRMFSIASLAIFQKIKESKNKGIKSVSENPLVSVIVPAYNEELTGCRTIEKLLESDYPNLEIIFVNDGSTDKTYEVVNKTFGENPIVKALTKENGGKASALNFGIENSTGEILVCIDADTILAKDAISKLIPYFESQNVAAVAGNVRVVNTVNVLTRWQSIEYTTSQNFDRRAFDTLNAILVVPGAIGAFRKTAMTKVGAFTTDTLAEDCDLTLRFLRAGYRIRSCNEALAFTEAPETMRNFLKQRTRWTFGMMQSLWKHRDKLFVSGKLNLSWVALPNLLIFNFIIPAFSPIVDILFIAGLFTYAAKTYILLYLLYFVIDFCISLMAYLFDKQKFTIRIASYLFVQRVVYRQLLFYVLYKSYLKAMKGEMVNWGVLKRTGNVSK